MVPAVADRSVFVLLCELSSADDSSSSLSLSEKQGRAGEDDFARNRALFLLGLFLLHRLSGGPAPPLDRQSIYTKSGRGIPDGGAAGDGLHFRVILEGRIPLAALCYYIINSNLFVEIRANLVLVPLSPGDRPDSGDRVPAASLCGGSHRGHSAGASGVPLFPRVGPEMGKVARCPPPPSAHPNLTAKTQSRLLF